MGVSLGAIKINEQTYRKRTKNTQTKEGNNDRYSDTENTIADFTIQINNRRKGFKFFLSLSPA